MADNGVTIDGADYPVPTLDTFTLDEAEIFTGYTGWVIEDFVPPSPEASDAAKVEYLTDLNEKMRQPSFAIAYMHIAYRREHEDMGHQEIRKVVGKVPVLDAILAIYGTPDEDPTPDSQNALANPSPSETPSSSEDSGSPSPTGSDRPAVTLAATGTGG